MAGEPFVKGLRMTNTPRVLGFPVVKGLRLTHALAIAGNPSVKGLHFVEASVGTPHGTRLCSDVSLACGCSLN